MFAQVTIRLAVQSTCLKETADSPGYHHTVFKTLQ